MGTTLLNNMKKVMNKSTDSGKTNKEKGKGKIFSLEIRKINFEMDKNINKSLFCFLL